MADVYLACTYSLNFVLDSIDFQAFKYEGTNRELKGVNAKEAKELLEIELTPVEFGEAMGLKPNSTFVESMFNLMDEVIILKI